MIAGQVRDRLRSSPAYRRAVWGMRLLLVSPFALLLVAVSAGLGVPKRVGLPLAAVTVGLGFAGVLLGWSAVSPLTRLSREIGEQHGLAPFQRAVLINRVFGRDVLGLRTRVAKGSR